MYHQKESWLCLDRDGVINHESSEYIKSPEEWHPIPGSLNAIAALSRANFKIVIMTNQSGIGRGYYTEQTLHAIHQKMLRFVGKAGGTITDIFYCPHHPDDGCTCRKPKTGLLQQFQVKHHVDFSKATIPFVGDSFRDLEAAHAMGCRPILVKTGFGEKTLISHADFIQKNHIRTFDNLAQVATHLLAP